DVSLPSVALRSANLRLQGSGQGSVSPRTYLGELPALVAEITAGTFSITPRPRPLAEVTEAWSHPDAPGERTVLVP
ncbi:MAG: zinc-binding alcohol dehydrogenase family protein, partial [Jatrophihabitans endophyticus]